MIIINENNEVPYDGANLYKLYNSNGCFAISRKTVASSSFSPRTVLFFVCLICN